MTTIQLPRGQFEYDETQPLGKPGGFGQVFAGRSGDSSQLAIKRLYLSAADAAHRELRIADELVGRTFTHVLPTFDSGEDASSGRYFIVMARASESLQEFIGARGRLTAAESAFVLLEIIAGLIEVAELVHRDLKPDNVLAHDGRWKVADFGIARFVEESTSLRTLQACLSRYYAAPEQWRQERATRATDVYALGCIGYCLLTGAPPFTTDPSEEHQHATVPPFHCDDPRLRSLIQMALRKLPESRPSPDRVRQILEQITNAPVIAAASAAAELAQAGAQIAEAQSREQAEFEALRSVKITRDALAKDALQRLHGIRENLWQAIIDAAPAARVKEQDDYAVEYELGGARLWMQTAGPNSALPAGGFRESKWDVITFSQMGVEQTKPQLMWSASLWFARLPQTLDYRWYEVSYVDINESGGLMPAAEMNIREADLAVAETVMHSMVVAFGPTAIDDEHEAAFQERWLWLLAKAARGHLNYVSTMPITQWPPTLV